MIAERQMTELKKGYSYIQVYKDLNESVHDMYRDAMDCQDSKNYKNLFNYELYNNCKYYIHKTDPKILERFKKIRESGRMIFLISNN